MDSHKFMTLVTGSFIREKRLKIQISPDKDGSILTMKSSIFGVVSDPARAICEVQELIPSLRSVASTTIADLVGSLLENEVVDKVSELEDEALEMMEVLVEL
ncbi:Oidioi.mRNA.OKI2018_I69.chr1.g3551.t1.cds [Oikopleura dioica]|uniref:Oidioi.mRNA.OKI2018_I69.chr1.g3551.t1.cds n=1 Tax=Oikopleura dioica TaxID=34765 RepID=A0ABN7SUF9_OIKDI|nr:Oidioi.mRNA.OKI2018_I69.chr1.g3551.t1.cds [Oikopleura dioica]